MRRTPLEWWLAVIISTAVIWISNHFGLWWITAIVGLALGLTALGAIPQVRRHRSAAGYSTVFFGAAVSGVAGWILPLLIQWSHAPIGAASGTIAGVMGFGTSSGWIVWVLTGLVGLLLALTACWLGLAVRNLSGLGKQGVE